MNYEKSYKEALERAKNCLKDGTITNIAISYIETIFPELKESEDEKIIKEIISYCRNTRCVTEEGAERRAKCIAWLKKQKKPEDMVHITELKVWPANSATAANRQLYNRAILTILSNYVEKYPDIRFGQMLCNLGVNPHFDEESRETYCNLNETINKQKS